jgi:hypothetical protein
MILWIGATVWLGCGVAAFGILLYRRPFLWHSSWPQRAGHLFAALLLGPLALCGILSNDEAEL